MQTLVVDHPLVTHKLTVLRDESTQAPTFRRLTDELVTLLAYEATREVPVRPVTVRTPVGDAQGVKMARPVPLVVPVLATGGTLETVFGMLISRGAAAVTGVSLLAAPEGIARLESAFGDDGGVPIRVVTAALDERLNDRGFIVPGLGDAGDRLFGEI